MWEEVFDFETSHIVTGYFGLIVILELTRRTFGLPLLLVTLLFILYAVFGRDLPWIFQHAGIDWVEIIRATRYSHDGVFERPAGIVANVVPIFIIFGAVLEANGAGAILLKMSFAATAAIRGGPAHAAIMASALFGTMSGSAMANVVGTGVFTTPMIKKQGSNPPFAGAVEAAASCSGQVTPPIMAAAAFFVAEFTGTPYLILIVAALTPALFKYIGIFAQVYAEAIRLNIRPIPKAERERLTRDDWRQSLRFFLPIAALILALLEGRSPAMAGAVAMGVALVTSFVLDLLRRSRGPVAFGAAWRDYFGIIAPAGYQCARLLLAIWLIATGFAGCDATGRLSIAFRLLRLAAGFVMFYPLPYFEAAAFVAGLVLYITGWIVRPRTPAGFQPA